MLAGLAQITSPDPDTLPWDPVLPYNDRPNITGPNDPNQGCPRGYFYQVVAPGSENSVMVSPGNAARCRFMGTTTPATITQESGTSWGEAYDIYAGAARATGKQIAGAIGSAATLGAGLGQTVLWGAALLIGGWLLLQALGQRK